VHSAKDADKEHEGLWNAGENRGSHAHSEIAEIARIAREWVWTIPGHQPLAADDARASRVNQQATPTCAPGARNQNQPAQHAPQDFQHGPREGTRIAEQEDAQQ